MGEAISLQYEVAHARKPLPYGCRALVSIDTSWARIAQGSEARQDLNFEFGFELGRSVVSELGFEEIEFWDGVVFGI